MSMGKIKKSFGIMRGMKNLARTIKDYARVFAIVLAIIAGGVVFDLIASIIRNAVRQ